MKFGVNEMYAVILTGGKQYRVEAGDRLEIEKLENEIGDSIILDKILLIGDENQIELGRPYVSNAQVSAEIIDQGRSDKVRTVKLKRRAHHLQHKGHRQSFTQIRIKDIQVKK